MVMTATAGKIEKLLICLTTANKYKDTLCNEDNNKNQKSNNINDLTQHFHFYVFAHQQYLYIPLSLSLSQLQV